MATMYCNLNTGSGLKKLNEHLLHRSYLTRQVSSLPFFLFYSQTLCNCSFETLICVVLYWIGFNGMKRHNFIPLRFQASNEVVSASTDKKKKKKKGCY